MGPGSPTRLERLLELAQTDPGVRPEFYRRLLESEVLVPIEASLHPGRTSAAGSLINVVCLVRADGICVIPFYTSPTAAYQARPPVEKCALMNVRELFEAKRGMHFHLNPFSACGREFLPDEAAQLLASGSFGAVLQHDLPEGAQLHPPSVAQPNLVQALSVLYARNPVVKAAYLVEVAPPEPALMVIIDAPAESARLVEDTLSVMCETATTHLPVQVAPLTDEDTQLAAYLHDVPPFYRRSLAGDVVSRTLS